MENAQVYAQYNSSLPAATSGNPIRIQADANGRLLMVSSGNVASGATDSGNPVKVGGVYNSSPITLTTGQRGDMQLDPNGYLKVVEQYADVAFDNTNGIVQIQDKPLAVGTYSPTQYRNFGANVTENIKATPGNVFSLIIRNLNAAERFLQLHNTATTPAGGAAPLLSVPVAGSGMVIVGNDFFVKGGWQFSTGIAMGFSTTQATYTAGTATDCFLQLSYK